MVLDVVNSQEQLDPATQSYGNPLEADIVACLVQFINEQAKVPFNRKMSCLFVDIVNQNLCSRNGYYHSV